MSEIVLCAKQARRETREDDMRADHSPDRRPVAFDRQHQRVVDDIVQAYVEWRMTCITLWEADRCWVAAPAPGAASAFQAYVDALNREEHACDAYARRMELAGPLAKRVREPVMCYAGRTAAP
jgi:hypothetical protein